MKEKEYPRMISCPNCGQRVWVVSELEEKEIRQKSCKFCRWSK